MSLKEIVEINISRETTGVAVAAFNVPLLLSTFATGKTTPAFSRARSYQNLKSLMDEGFTSSDEIYKMARAVFAQNPSVSRIVVGRLDADDESIEEGLALIQNEDNSFYGVLADQTVLGADAEDLADWVEAEKRFMILWSSDVNCYNALSVSDIAYKLKTEAMERTAVLYHAAPASGNDYPDAAWMGEGFPFNPGTSTWAFKTLAGIAVDNIGLKEVALKGKNCNFYESIGGVNITQEGKVASGEWIDIIIGTDWIEARLREAVYGTLVNNRKVPYDDNGITMEEGIVRGVLSEAANAGIIQADSIVVTVPKYADISQADKVARKLPAIRFTALYLGAFHAVSIDGTISI